LTKVATVAKVLLPRPLRRRGERMKGKKGERMKERREKGMKERAAP
jgi:hypothetical protein